VHRRRGNAKGGVKVGANMRKLEAVKYDYQSETSRAVQIVQRLVTVDKVDLLFAPYGSGDTKATAVLAERYGIPMIATSASSESVYDQKGKNLFGILFPTGAMVTVEAKYYKERVPQAKKARHAGAEFPVPEGDRRRFARRRGEGERL